MSVLTLCPRCGDTGSDTTATCRYCGYVGTIPLTLEEDRKWIVTLKGDEDKTLTHAECLVKSEAYLDELREKYQLKQGEKCDQELWNNRQKRDENELKQSKAYDEALWNNRQKKYENWVKGWLQELKEDEERSRQEKEQQSKLSWKDRNKAIGVTCPTCGSSDRVYRISAAKKGFLAGLMGAMSAGLQAKTFQCKNCGYKW